MKRSSCLIFFWQSLAIEWKSLPKRRSRLYVCMTPIILLHSDTNFATLKKWNGDLVGIQLFCRKISILGQWVRISITCVFVHWWNFLLFLLSVFFVTIFYILHVWTLHSIQSPNTGSIVTNGHVGLTVGFGRWDKSNRTYCHCCFLGIG